MQARKIMHMAPLVLAGLIALSGVVVAQNASGNRTNYFFPFVLFNDSVSSWNARTRFNYSVAGNCTELKASCSNVSFAGSPPAGFMNVSIYPPNDIILKGINQTRWLFSEGCLKNYVGEPKVVLDSFRNATWAGKPYVAFSVGVGCETRNVSGEWSNYWNAPAGYGSGYHKEYASDIRDELRVYSNGRLCYNDSNWIDSGDGTGVIGGVRIVEANCTIENDTIPMILFEHKCTGYAVLDHATIRMSWIITCDREWYLQKVCLPNCEARNSYCRRRKPPCATTDCNRYCNGIADKICFTEKGPKPVCRTPPGGQYGSPDDGSSVSHIPMPGISASRRACRCSASRDPSNSCWNNLVSSGFGETLTCSETKTIYVTAPAVARLGGYYSVAPSFIEGSLFLNVTPDVLSSFVVDGIYEQSFIWAPRHELYKMEGVPGVPFKTYRLVDNAYEWNGTHNDSKYFDFVLQETVANEPPYASGRFSVRNVEKVNGTYRIDFTFTGTEDELKSFNLTVLSIGDRLNMPTNNVSCSSFVGCNDSNYPVCVDNLCSNLSRVNASQTVSLMNLSRRNNTALSFSYTGAVKAGGSVNIMVKLTDSGASNPLKAKSIHVLEVTGNFTGDYLTDANGLVNFTLNITKPITVVEASFEGDYQHSPSSGRLPLTYSEFYCNWPILLMLLLLLLLIALIFSVAQGKFTIHDIIQEFKGMFK